MPSSFRRYAVPEAGTPTREGGNAPHDKEARETLVRKAPVVLMYHGIDEVDAAKDAENLFVPVQAFTAQMEYLQRSGYRVLSESEYLEWLDGRPLDGRSVLLTFDDGYVSIQQHAAPLLARLGMPGICYVCPGLLGGQSTWMAEPSWHDLMDADQLAEIMDAGIALGVHGHDHSPMHSLTLDELEKHTRGAADLLEEKTGARARTLAYPYGYHSASSRQAVSASGLEGAFAIYRNAGRWALPRVDINSLDTPRTFRLKLASLYPTARRALSVAPPVRHALHTLVGRAQR